MAGAAPQEIQTGILRPGDVGYNPRSQVSATLPNTQQNPMLTNALSQAAGQGNAEITDGYSSTPQQILPGTIAAGQPMMGMFGGELMPVGEPAPFPGGQRSFSDGPQMQGGKGGLGGAQPTPAQAASPSPQYAPMVPQQQGFNVNQASAGALQQALGATQQGLGFTPQGIGAQTYKPAQIAGTDLSPYTNPYESQVIQQSLRDLGGAQEQSLNQLGAQATAAKAFGGSRQGIAEAETRKAYGQQAADLTTNMRQQGYQTALGLAGQDVGAQTAAQQYAAQQRASAQAQNLAAQQAAASTRLGAASQLGQLGQQAFGTGQAIQQQQMQQGLLQQGIQQALIDAARQQYAGYTGAPTTALQAPLAALGVTPTPQSTTNSMQPGLFNYLQLGAGMVPSLAKAGIICWVAREVYGKDDPKWLQFREWVIGYSPDWFYKAYSKYGENVAKVVAKVPALKAVIRPFMDAKRKALGFK